MFRRQTHALLIALAAVSFASTAEASITYITDFSKDNNIYTNLNEQFPNTGPGVPGSQVGTPNASFLFDPQTFNSGNTNNLNYVGNNGISFDLTSNATGQDFAQVGPTFGTPLLALPINVSNATNIYLLAGAYNGTSFNITLTGTGGATQTFSNIAIPDFNGGSINSVAGGVADQTVYRVLDVGAGGSGNSATGAYNYYDLTEIGLTLGSQFNGQTLTSAAITSSGFETLILGATVSSASVANAVPEPSTWAMMLLGFGGLGALFVKRREMTPAV